MSAGIENTKPEIDRAVGTVARDLNDLFSKIASVKTKLDATPDADLLALGYNSSDIANIKSTYNDLNLLRELYEGTTTLPLAKDFRTFAKRIFGFGYV